MTSPKTRRRTGRPPSAPKPKTRAEIAELERRLEEAEESLKAIRAGEVDALVIKSPRGDQVYTLKEADRPYRMIIENMRDGTLTIRDDGLVLCANKQLAAMLGTPLENLLGSNLLDWAEPAAVEPLRILIGKAAEDGARADVELRGADGRSLLANLSLAPIRIEGDRVLSGIAADITAETRLEQKVLQMERTEALGRLAGGVAHDLNNILQPILLNAELLLSETEPGTRPHSLLKNLLQAARRQKDLVAKILMFTRRTKRDFQTIPMTPLVEEALKLLKPSLPAAVEVRFDAAAGDAMVDGDPIELHELVTNLYSNAVDAMERRGGLLEVGLADSVVEDDDPVRDLPAGRYLKLTVKDTGCGISGRDLARIFDPFFTTKPTGKGTGIGLSIVRGIVKNHKGAIEVKSGVGAGTEVCILLPASRGDAPLDEAGARAEIRSTVQGRRVLLVDDEDLVLDTMRMALASLGIDAAATTNADEALALFRGAPQAFDLAILDQTMPRMSGLELAGELARLRPGLPILLATGYSRAVDEQSLRQAGVSEVVMKPMSLKDLAAAVQRALISRPEPE